MTTVLANDTLQPLDEHLFAIGYLSSEIMKKMGADKSLIDAAYLAGCWHDMGKADPKFQGWLQNKIAGKKGTKLAKNYPRHNEISYLLFHLLNNEKLANPAVLEDVEHVVFWHHDKWLREEDLSPLQIFDVLGSATLKKLSKTVGVVVENINGFASTYFNANQSRQMVRPTPKPNAENVRTLPRQIRPPYKEYYPSSDLRTIRGMVAGNKRKSLIRSAVVTADHYVSSLKKDELNSHIKNKTLHTLLEELCPASQSLQTEIKNCVARFEEKYPASDRNKEQAKAADYLGDEETHIGVLEGVAGCGKTKIALEWAAKTEVQKIIWVCPRVQICEGLVKLLTSADYLPNAKIEINTGDFKYIYQAGKKEDAPKDKLFSGDIVLTTIDQISNSIITHKGVTTLVDYMNAHVVFDEFHEYINLPAFNLMFAELVQCKQEQEENTHILLVSATPNYFYVKDFLGVQDDDIYAVPSFNKNPYRIDFIPFDERVEDQGHPLFKQQPPNTFVISNTATTAQKSFIDNHKKENALLYHSKFIKRDKEEIFQKVFECFGEEGRQDYDILRAGPIVQASLDISCTKMVTEFTHAENWLQRLGRLDRFAQSKKDNHYTIAVPEIIHRGGVSGSCVFFLRKLYSLESALAWHNFIKDKVERQALTLEDLYQHYRDFYKTKACQQAVKKDLLACLKKGIERVTHKAVEPVKFKKSPTTEEKKSLKFYSLRGDSRYVQMAQCKVVSRTPKGVTYLNEYICDLDPKGDNNMTLTLSLEELFRERGDKNQSLLTYMVDKDYLIFPKKYSKSKWSRNTHALLSKARYPNAPIYTSYTPSDLKRKKEHEEAVYYAVCDEQPIGAMTKKNFKKKRKTK